MTKEEAKQYLRNQIDSCIKTQDEFNKIGFFLSYNKNYLRVLKLSTITGQPVNKKDFYGGEPLFGFDTGNKTYWYYNKIRFYLTEHYSNVVSEQIKLITSVLNEYDEYKGYK